MKTQAKNNPKLIILGPEIAKHGVFCALYYQNDQNTQVFTKNRTKIDKNLFNAVFRSF